MHVQNTDGMRLITKLQLVSYCHHKHLLSVSQTLLSKPSHANDLPLESLNLITSFIQAPTCLQGASKQPWQCSDRSRRCPTRLYPWSCGIFSMQPCRRRARLNGRDMGGYVWLKGLEVGGTPGVRQT